MRTRLFAILIAVAAVAACGDDDGTTEVDRYPELPAADPLNLADVELGIGLEPGSAAGLAEYRAEFFGDLTTTFPNAVLHVQSYDEAAQTVGEWRVMTPPSAAMGTYRGPIEFRDNNVTAGQFEARVADLYADNAAAAAAAGSDNFQTTTVVLETWRLKRDWHVRWDGTFSGEGNNRNKGNYGFFRDDFRDSLLDQVESVAATHQPRYFILGTEIERLFRSSEGPGIAPGEYANFVLFYREAVSRIRAASPNTLVGAGVNWDRFALQVSQAYGNSETMSQDEMLDRAFERFMLPLVQDGGLIALSTYRGPVDGDDPTAHYQWLRRVPDLYETEAPIVFYSVGAPIDSAVEYPLQRTMIEEFTQWTAGVPVEFVAWRSALNYDGTDTNDQTIQARCAALSDPSGTLGMPVERCFDGLITSVFSKKAIFDYFEGSL